MTENSEHKKCQQNLLNYVSHNLNSKVDKEKEKEKERSEGKNSADKPSATSAKIQRPKQSAQGPGNKGLDVHRVNQVHEEDNQHI